MIELGCIGWMCIATSVLLISGMQPALHRLTWIRSNFTSDEDLTPSRIMASLFGITLLVESAGTLLLYPKALGATPYEKFFFSFFHSVSAFCNAGFSLLSDSLETFKNDGVVIFTFSVLIVLVGLGFFVIDVSIFAL